VKDSLVLVNGYFDHSDDVFLDLLSIFDFQIDKAIKQVNLRPKNFCAWMMVARF